MSETMDNAESNAESTSHSGDPRLEIEGLKQKLQEVEKVRDDYLTLAKSTRAEFENYQKRQQRDLQIERRYAQVPLASDLLPAIDNLERAIEAASKAGDNGPLTQGVKMVFEQFLGILKRHGVEKMDCLNKPFDPNHHEAVAQFPVPNAPPQTVVQVLELGWTMHDRVIRPAKVAISAPCQNPENPASH